MTESTQPRRTVEPRREVEVLRTGSKVGVVLATLLTLALGAFAFYGVVHQPDLGTGGRIIGSVIGLMFGGLGLGLLCLAKLPAMMGRHTLVFDHYGVAYETTRGGVPFRVTWPEVGDIAVSTATRRSRNGDRTLVRLDLTPTDAASFAVRHPEMKALHRGGSWRLPLGPNPYVIAPVTAALADYAGVRNRGVRDDGPATGLTYT